MTKTITGVPESITRAKVVELVAAVGFDPFAVVELDFGLDGIWATVKARNENGHDVIDYPRNEVVKHRVFVPVVD